MAKHTTHSTRLHKKQAVSGANSAEEIKKPQSEDGANKDHKEDFEKLLDDAICRKSEPSA